MTAFSCHPVQDKGLKREVYSVRWGLHPGFWMATTGLAPISLYVMLWVFFHCCVSLHVDLHCIFLSFGGFCYALLLLFCLFFELTPCCFL